MIVNPICHWSGGEPDPLLNFAPGQPTAEYGTGPQLPPDQPFYYSAAAMTAAGVSAAPYTIYGFQESAGTPPQDLVGTNHLISSGLKPPPQDVPAIGLFTNGSFTDLSKRCINPTELYGSGYFYHPTAHDPGNDSFAVFTIAKVCSSVTGNMVSKKASASAVGWYLANPFAALVEEVGGLNATSSTNFYSLFGIWAACFLYIDRTANTLQLRSSSGDGALIDITGWGSITSPSNYQVGDSGVHHAIDCMIAYQAFWTGAAAESMRANHLTNFPILWKHGAAPQNCPVDDAGIIGVSGCQYDSGRNTTCGLVGYDSALGVLQSNWYQGQAPGGGAYDTYCQFPFQWNPGLTRANGLGMAVTENDEQNQTLFRMTDASWTAVNGTKSAAGADMHQGPDGNHNAGMFTSTASPGTLRYSDITAVAGETWATGVEIIRGKNEVADVVGCRLIAWDDNNLAEIASVTFTATEEWEWHNFDFVVPVGCVDVQVWIEVPWAGVDRAVHAIGWTTARIDMQPQAMQPCATPDVEANYNTAPGAFMKGAQGEIEIVFICECDYVEQNRWLFHQQSNGGTTDRNCHLMYINTSKQIVVELYDSAGALRSTLTSAAIADLKSEVTVVYRWNIAGLPSGDKHEISINGGAYTGLAAAAWATATDTVDLFEYGEVLGGVSIVATKAAIRIWEFPR